MSMEVRGGSTGRGRRSDMIEKRLITEVTDDSYLEDDKSVG